MADYGSVSQILMGPTMEMISMGCHGLHQPILTYKFRHNHVQNKIIILILYFYLIM